MDIQVFFAFCTVYVVFSAYDKVIHMNNRCLNSDFDVKCKERVYA